MQRLFGRTLVMTAFLGLMVALTASTALAQYQMTNLTSDLTGKAKHTDPLLKNAWGLAFSTGGFVQFIKKYLP